MVYLSGSQPRQPVIAEELRDDFFTKVSPGYGIKFDPTSDITVTTSAAGIKLAFTKYPLVISPQYRGGVVGSQSPNGALPLPLLPVAGYTITNGRLVIPADGVYSIEFASILSGGGVFNDGVTQTNNAANLFVYITLPDGSTLDYEYGFPAVFMGSNIIYMNASTTQRFAAGTTFGLGLRLNNTQQQMLSQYPGTTNLRISRLL